MQAVADQEADQSSPSTHTRTPAKRRDSYRLTTALHFVVSCLLLGNVALWLPAPAQFYAPVIPAWLQEVLALGLLSLVGQARAGQRMQVWLVYALQPFGILNITFANTVLTPTYTVLAALCAAITAGAALILMVLAYRSTLSTPTEQPQGRLADFKMLMKFRIISLLLLTTLVPMYLANGGEWPALWVVLLTLLGGTLAAGGANAINMYWDRDIDAVMTRTRRRPLPGNRMQGREVLGFGVLLSGLSFVVLLPVNLLTALLAFSGILYYVVIYTMWLKRSTVQNIVIGGGAGAIPPMVGWAAGADLDIFHAAPGEWLPAIFLFAIVFYWTPPHFWALAIIRRDEYARAGVPMLPVVKSETETRLQIVLYSLLMFAITIMLVSLGVVGMIYLVSAVVLGGLFLWYAVRMLHDYSHAAAWRLYKYSLLYLALLFVMMGIDKALL